MNWLANNLGVVISLAVLLFAGIGAWYSNGARISRLEEKLDSADKAHSNLAESVTTHLSNTAIHIDPARDKKIWEDFKGEAMRRFDRLDDKMDKMMLIHPVPPV